VGNKLTRRSQSPRGQLHFGRIHYHAGDDHDRVRGRLAFAGFSLLVVFVGGTLGYYFIGHGQWSLRDCAYMVLITLTTVGYGEVIPVSSVPEGRTFTMMLLVGGVGVSLYFLSSLTAFIVEGDLREALWRRRMHKRLDALRNHFIICGVGSTGRYVLEELLRAGKQVVVVELDKSHLDRVVHEHGDAVIAIEADATDDGVLKEAGIERAAGLVTTMQLDQDNLFVALSARGFNDKLRIVCRASDERVRPKLMQAGADVVVSPTHIGGRRMAHELLRPGVVGFLDFMAADVERNLDIEEVEIVPNSPLVGKTLAKSRIREVSSALVLAVSSGSRHTYNPPADFRFEAGMTLVVLGEREQIERLTRYVSGERGSFTLLTGTARASEGEE
jgi:voltage-gated potassium channel